MVVILGDTPQGTRAERPTVRQADHHLQRRDPAQSHPHRAQRVRFFQASPPRRSRPSPSPPMSGRRMEGRTCSSPLQTALNGEQVGDVDAGLFSFADLIQHICKTRSFTAGTLLGSGTVSNEDRTRGISCLAERRMIEIIDEGQASTSFLSSGDTVHIEMRNATATACLAPSTRPSSSGHEAVRLQSASWRVRIGLALKVWMSNITASPRTRWWEATRAEHRQRNPMRQVPVWARRWTTADPECNPRVPRRTLSTPRLLPEDPYPRATRASSSSTAAFSHFKTWLRSTSRVSATGPRGADTTSTKASQPPSMAQPQPAAWSATTSPWPTSR